MRRKNETLPNEMAGLGTAIRERRLQLGLSQKEFAGRIGIPTSTMNNIEVARNWPSLPVYITICRALRMGRIPLVKAA